MTKGSISALSLGALGVVFGDIGTSPLYTFKVILNLRHNTPEVTSILGLLSLVIWTLIIITSIKYIFFAMRFDNDGEGGIMALMSLFGAKKKRRLGIIAFGLFGAALIYGDGAITPAISVLSALEGLVSIHPSFEAHIVPVAVLILLLLFSIQSLGTAWIGRVFGPIMLLWFLSIGLLGISGILQHPSVLLAVNPHYAVHYLLNHGFWDWLVLGGVFLCVTGAEALYADMGHMGRKPITLSWFALVFPCLVLNYAGQAALVIEGVVSVSSNTFYALCPSSLLIPMIVLSTVATIIASQAIITGAFSMTRQAILLGWLPRLFVKQTSSQGYGQIYIGVVNFLLMVVTLWLTIVFKKSSNLASAYGIAVSLTMLMTSFLLFIAMRQIWGWNKFKAGSVAALFIFIDSSFVIANLTKVAEGGYIPLLLAIIIYGLMWTWHRGSKAVLSRIHKSVLPISRFMSNIKKNQIPRVPGTAIFLTRSTKGIPPVMAWHVKQNRALHEKILVLRVVVKPVPRVYPSQRLTIKEKGDNFWRVVARYGFMEQPNIGEIMRECQIHGCAIDLNDLTYYVGRDTIIASSDKKALPPWQQNLYAMMERNATQISDFFSLPVDNVVEIGRQIAI